MSRLLLWMAALTMAVGPLMAQAAAPQPQASIGIVSIGIEMRTANGIRTMDSRHVFAGGDTIRFRLRPQVNGYLYVLDLNTSGKYEVLFPREETGSDNRIEQGRVYLLPATSEGWFRVSGPAGHERLYFVLSPVELAPGHPAGSSQPLPPQGVAPSTMKPRCNDGIFRARGECLDMDAGPKTVAPGESLPREIAHVAPGASRDLEFVPSRAGSTVSTAGPLSGPVVYEFLLAHN